MPSFQPIIPSDFIVYKALRALLLAALPVGVPVLQGQVNRVAEPKDEDYVVYWPLMENRLATNLDLFMDMAFTASIVGDVMTVTEVTLLTEVLPFLGPNVIVFSPDVQDNTRVTEILTGIGGVGTYRVSPSQNVTSEKMACGQETHGQSTEQVMQVDVHGPNAFQNSRFITTLLRDEKGVDIMQAVSPYVVPLYADDAVQTPFVNEQEQYENRYTITARIEVESTMITPQQFADQLAMAGIFSVDVEYPPT